MISDTSSTAIVRDLVYVSRSTLPSTEANSVHVAHMCEAFVGAGWRVQLRAARGSDPASPREYYALQREFEIRFETRVGHALWLLRRAASLRRRAPPVYYGRRIAAMERLARLGYPVMLELHYLPGRRLLRRVQRLVGCRRFLGLVVISAQLKLELMRRVAGLDEQAVLVSHDAVRAGQIQPPRIAPTDAVRVVYSGSLHPGKGIETLLAAAAQVPQAAFDIFGGSAEQIDGLRARAPRNVTFHGHLPHAELMPRLRRYDIALAPYGRVVEGARQRAGGPNLADWMSPLKLFEYTAAGLPVVTSDLPVLRELLRHDVSALMTEPGNAVELAAAVFRLGQDPQLRRRLVENAQRELGRHTWENRALELGAYLDRRLALMGS